MLQPGTDHSCSLAAVALETCGHLGAQLAALQVGVGVQRTAPCVHSLGNGGCVCQCGCGQSCGPEVTDTPLAQLTWGWGRWWRRRRRRQGHTAPDPAAAVSAVQAPANCGLVAAASEAAATVILALTGAIGTHPCSMCNSSRTAAMSVGMSVIGCRCCCSNRSLDAWRSCGRQLAAIINHSCAAPQYLT